MIHVSDKGHSLLTHLDINCRVYSVYAYARILVIRVYRNYQLIFLITLSTKRDAYVICRTNTIQHSLYCYEQFNMKLCGSLLVIVCCLVVEFCDINQKEYLILASGNLAYTISVITILGLLFLLYPCTCGSPNRCLHDQVS